MTTEACSRILARLPSPPSCSSTFVSAGCCKGLRHNSLHGNSEVRGTIRASANQAVRRITERALSWNVRSTPIIAPMTTYQRGVPMDEHEDFDVHVDDSVADIWRQVQGSDYWNNMLDPMHPCLRSEITRYGEFVNATYEAFEFESRSQYYGSCKYGRKGLFGEVGMADCGYEVTEYIYATPDISQLPGVFKQEGNKCNWIGFVAVAQREEEIRRLGRRDICVALRGTATLMEWVANFMGILTPARFDPQNPRHDIKVELGFLSLYTSYDTTTSAFSNLGSAREQLLREISRLVRKYKGENLSITLTGHSMGSALALLCAYDVAELGLNRQNHDHDQFPIPTTVFSFGGPRVGNAAFRDRCDELGVRTLRVVNVRDLIPKLPGVIFNESTQFLENRVDRYTHVGVELALDPDHCPSKLTQLHPSCFHELGTYMHLLKCTDPNSNCSDALPSLEPSISTPHPHHRHPFSLLDKALNLVEKIVILSLLRMKTPRSSIFDNRQLPTIPVSLRALFGGLRYRFMPRHNHRL